MQIPDRLPNISIRRILIKVVILFLIINFGLPYLPAGSASKLSLYNHLVPGRQRFPFGENAQKAYNLTIESLPAMFASHVVSQPKAMDEYRVMVIGDSSVWGTLLRPEQTLTGVLNAMNLQTAAGQRVVFYNLGYPTLSLAKDWMFLQAASEFQPDQILWLVTLESFPWDKQWSVPIVQQNLERAMLLAEQAPALKEKPAKIGKKFLEGTLIGRRKQIGDWFRLQMYGLLWAATGIDQEYPSDFPAAQVDLKADDTFHGETGWEDPIDTYLAFKVMQAAIESQGNVPVVIINEPILISDGENSDIRYNFYYPRWAYDHYLKALEDFTSNSSIRFLNPWNLIDQQYFSNSAIHLNANGQHQLADFIADALYR